MPSESGLKRSVFQFIRSKHVQYAFDTRTAISDQVLEQTGASHYRVRPMRQRTPCLASQLQPCALAHG